MPDEQRPPFEQWLGQSLTSTADVNRALNDLYRSAAGGACHALRGRIRLPSVVPGFAVVLHEVWPQPEDDVIDMKGKGRMYSARFIRKLADMAGLSVVRVRRLDDDSDPNVRESEVTIEGRDLTGRSRRWVGTYELDLRDGGARADAAGRGLRDKRQHIAQAATTGAMCRAIVDALAIRRGFKAGDEAVWLPMILPNLEVHLESASPAVRDAITLQALSAVMGTFGPAPEPPPAMPAPGADDMGPIVDDPDGPDGMPYDPDEPDETPFNDAPPKSAAPSNDAPPKSAGPPDPEPQSAAEAQEPAPSNDAPDGDRDINDAEKDKLKSLGLYRKAILAKVGWDAGRPVKLSEFKAVIEQFGGSA